MPLKRDPRLAWQLVGDEVIVLDVASGTARGLNPVASFIWTRLENETPEEICSGLVREFETDEETARRDFGEFIDALRARKLLEEHP